MRVTSEAMNGGPIPDRFGKRGGDMNAFGIPSRSIPIKIEDAPQGTVTYALLLEDKDAAPVCGFSWIHWIAANIRRDTLEEDDSAHATDYVQGINSWFGNYGREGSVGYGGMTPPDRPHTYELHVFALDRELALDAGFFINDLYHEMEGHILAHERLTGTYPN